ncbi:MAG TPA: protease modulator HflC [Candidatus Tectomicrobia bacterium]|nr:protease modulator HflC [Candidatus Tectomicrobia bacterium]
MKKIVIVILVVFVALWVLVPQALFTIDEREQAIITQFGAYIRTITESGLHVKTPFVQTVHRFDKRVLAVDAAPAEYLTLDRKRLVVDFVARWRITDPLAFFTSVATLDGARARIEDIVFSGLRQAIASQDFAPVTSEQREPTMEAVANAARARTQAFGIDLIDVRIKRADLPREVQQSVFARMVAERERISKRYRSEGEEEAAKLRAETDKEREIILAQAYERSQRLHGEGDAAATAVYASAYEQNPQFYFFTRTLEAYDDILTPETLLVLPADTAMFRLLKGPPSTE